MVLIWFTSEAQVILDEQEAFLEQQYEIYDKLNETMLLTRDDIVKLFQKNHPEIEDQPKMVRRGG